MHTPACHADGPVSADMLLRRGFCGNRNPPEFATYFPCCFPIRVVEWHRQKGKQKALSDTRNREAKDQGKREEQGAGKVLFVRGIGGDSSWDARRQGFPAGKHDPGCRAAVHLPGKEMRIPVSPRKGPTIWPMCAGFNPSGNASGGHSGQPCPCASRRLKCRQHAGKEEP